MRHFLIRRSFTAAIAIALLLVVGAASAAAQPLSDQVPSRKAPCETFHTYGIPLEPKDVPAKLAEIVAFIPKGQKLFDFACTATEGGDTATYFLVTGYETQIGTLSLFTRRANGTLKLEASNKTVVQGSMLAGMSGGYKGIDVGRNTFTIKNSFGGGGVVANYAFTFNYSLERKTWMVESIVEEDFDGIDQPPTHTSKTIAKTQLGRVSFRDFDGTKYGIVTGE